MSDDEVLDEQREVFMTWFIMAIDTLFSQMRFSSRGYGWAFVLYDIEHFSATGDFKISSNIPMGDLAKLFNRDMSDKMEADVRELKKSMN